VDRAIVNLRDAAATGKEGEGTMGDLNDILNGSEGTETETEAIETEQVAEQPEQEAEQVEAETGVNETQAAAETETTPEPEEVKGLRAAAAAERKKRQEIEQELAQARQMLAQQPKTPEEEKPFLGEEYEQRFKETETTLKEELVQTKIMMSREFAMDKYTDYEAKEADFIEMARANPALVDQMRASANPAAFAYKTVSDFQQVQKLREIGDPVKYEAALTERIRAQVEAEYLAKQEAAKKEATEAAIRAKLKPGFAEERSSGPARLTTKTYDGPTPLKTILG
jgi:hypothetical protein